MSAPHSTTEAIYDTETKMYAMYVNGELVGFAWDIAEARATLSEFDAPRYELLLDCAGPDVPLDGPSVEEEGGEGGEPPPDDFTGHLHFIIGEDGEMLSPSGAPLPATPSGRASAEPAAQAPAPNKRAAYLERAARARSAWACRVSGITVAIRHQGRIVAYHKSAYVAQRAAEALREVA